MAITSVYFLIISSLCSSAITKASLKGFGPFSPLRTLLIQQSMAFVLLSHDGGEGFFLTVVTLRESIFIVQISVSLAIDCDVKFFGGL